MMQRIVIHVEVPDRHCSGSVKELYFNSVEVDDSVAFDYQNILKALKLLYPFDRVMVSFSIM